MNDIKPGTPLPWWLEKVLPGDKKISIGGTTKFYGGQAFVSVDYDDIDPEEMEANAAYIVHAANSLPSLEARVKVLERALEETLRNLELASPGHGYYWQKKAALNALKGATK